VNKSEHWTISTKQQFAISSWITCGEGKDRVERIARSGASVKRTVGASVKQSRSRAKRSSGIEGEAVEATACSGGEVVEGALSRQQRALGVGGVEECSVSGQGGGGGVEDLKRASSKNLLSVEWAARAPNSYTGGQMHDTRSVRRVAHYFRCVTHYF
jgi:hypothetical protein